MAESETLYIVRDHVDREVQFNMSESNVEKYVEEFLQMGHPLDELEVYIQGPMVRVETRVELKSVITLKG